jgi:phospholipid/cholesterol/gamma-HCH transport system substrate-binding protein
MRPSRPRRETDGAHWIEVGVGLFMLAGFVALAYLSINLGKVEWLGRSGYSVYADFPTVGGLKKGAAVEIAGVEIGRVESIGLKDYQARVTMRIDQGIKVQSDAIVSIKTKGLIGERFVQINPGGSSDKTVAPGGRLTEVEAPVDLEELISKYVFGQL